ARWLLLFLGAGHLRGLPAFPTRRSSDLEPQAWAAAARGAAGAGRHRDDRGARRPGLGGGRARGGPGPPRPRRARGALWRGPAREDRKSTRLNSSHVKISYAVFCLKKKQD